MTDKILTKNHKELCEQVQLHLEADAVIQGTYWRRTLDNKVKGEGCFIGCLSHANNPTFIENKYGIPLTLIRILEEIFEAQEADEAKCFFEALPKAIGRDEKDLNKIQWRLFLWGLEKEREESDPYSKGRIDIYEKVKTALKSLLREEKVFLPSLASLDLPDSTHLAASISYSIMFHLEKNLTTKTTYSIHAIRDLRDLVFPEELAKKILELIREAK